jgi:hypothetical protein
MDVLMFHGTEPTENTFLRMRVYWFFTHQRMSSYCWKRKFGNVFTESLPTNNHMSHNNLLIWLQLNRKQLKITAVRLCNQVKMINKGKSKAIPVTGREHP